MAAMTTPPEIFSTVDMKPKTKPAVEEEEEEEEEDGDDALWSGSTKNGDVSTGPLARSFARSLAPLTRSLAPDCSLAHFAHSLTGGTLND